MAMVSSNGAQQMIAAAEVVERKFDEEVKKIRKEVEEKIQKLEEKVEANVERSERKEREGELIISNVKSD